MSAQNSQNPISNMLDAMAFKTKFIMVIALPVLAFAYFAYVDINSKMQYRHDAEVIHSITSLNVAVSGLVHELQKERGATAVFLKSKGKKFANEIVTIRKVADQKTQELEEAMTNINMAIMSDVANKSLNKAMQGAMKKLISTRAQVDAYAVTPKQTGEYYTDFIASLLEVIAEGVAASKDSETISRASAYYNILMAKELAGQERAAVAGIFGGNSLENVARAKAMTLIAGQEIYFTRFKATATAEEVTFFNAKMTGSSIGEVERMRNLIKMGIAGSNLNTEASYWFGQSTQRINLINDVSLVVADELLQFTEVSMAEVTNELNTRFTAIGILFAIGFLFSFVVAKQSIVQERQGAISGSALENLANNVLVADENDSLMYMNRASQTALLDLQDEIGKTFSGFDASKMMGKSIHDFHKNPENVRRILRGLREGEQHSANIKLGDLTLRLGIGGIYQRGKRIGTYAEWANITAQVAAEETKARIEREVNDVALTINNATRDISQGNINLSERTEAQAASIEETTATMQQITERVNESASNAKSALEVASTTREAADRGGNVVKDAIQAMEEISASSDKISDIIGVIDEIAFQTNLLALNAAVEAARAGEQGRGFAVVASEVRTLAGRSATAAKEIKDLISESVEKVKIGTEQVNETGGCLDDIITNVQKVSDMVNGISEASQEQALSISEVNKTVTQMDSFTQQNAALVEEAASASKSLEEQASNLVAVMRGEAPSPTGSGMGMKTAANSHHNSPAAVTSATAVDDDDGEWKEF